MQPTSSTLSGLSSSMSGSQNSPRRPYASRLRSTYSLPNSPAQRLSSRWASLALVFVEVIVLYRPLPARSRTPWTLTTPRVALMQPTFLPWQGLLRADRGRRRLRRSSTTSSSSATPSTSATGSGSPTGPRPWITVPVAHPRATPSSRSLPTPGRWSTPSGARRAQGHARPELRQGRFHDAAATRGRRRGSTPTWPSLAAMNIAFIRLVAELARLRARVARSRRRSASTGERSERSARPAAPRRRGHLPLRARLVRVHGRRRAVPGRRRRRRVPGLRAAAVPAAQDRRRSCHTCRSSTRCSRSARTRRGDLVLAGQRAWIAWDDMATTARRPASRPDRRPAPAPTIDEAHAVAARRAASRTASRRALDGIGRQDRADVRGARERTRSGSRRSRHATVGRPRQHASSIVTPPAVTTRSAPPARRARPSGACTMSTSRSSPCAPHGPTTNRICACGMNVARCGRDLAPTPAASARAGRHEHAVHGFADRGRGVEAQARDRRARTARPASTSFGPRGVRGASAPGSGSTTRSTARSRSMSSIATTWSAAKRLVVVGAREVRVDEHDRA